MSINNIIDINENKNTDLFKSGDGFVLFYSENMHRPWQCLRIVMYVHVLVIGTR